jgi:DUF4097 and DUF4098 domain-containing protein YvlB
MQRQRPALPGLTALALGVMVGVGTATVHAQDFEWRGRVAQGNSVEIKNINGDVEAVRGTGDQVEVTAVKREGDRGDPEDVTFEVIEHDEGVTICAVYPDDGRRPNECRPGRGGRMNVHRNNTEVHFTVRLPAGVDFIGKSVNGDVTIDGVDGDAVAHTVNGDIRVAAAGAVEATTVNGSIDASMGAADFDDDLEFTTVNGSITLELPDGVNADVSASTVNGGMETDFPLTVQGRWGPRHLRGTIGSGGRRIELETVNGRIALRRQ